MPQLPTQWNSSAAQASLAPVASSPEYYIPLWWHSGGVALGTSVSVTSVNTSWMIQKGATGVASISSSATKLHTLNSAWSASTQFAFEVYAGTASTANTLSIALYDITAGGVIVGSTIGASGASLVIRSGKFSLSAGHTYGIVVWNTGNANSCYLTDCSLIVFPL